ncbi:UNVERIFIED_CONTAM: hypothetical protein Sradi_0774500 [Sesamum radiatum]|uniref:Uncharacterized protein n=1 Tax=Sesamum radiatum TaxID=300843 RepID=A0AAW2VPT4_SESRA
MFAAFEFLDKINKEKWTASHDGGWRTGILTTNMSECINGVLKGARRLPLTAIVEITLARTVNYFVTRERRSHAMVASGQLGRILHIRCSINGIKNLLIIPSQNTITANSPHRLLQNGSRDLDSILMLSKSPIENVHAVSGLNLAFLVHTLKKYALHNINAASMVKNYYDVQAYKNTYSKAFQLLYPEDYWDAPEFRLVHDTTIRISTRPGRNQTSRIHNEMDWRQTRERQQAQQRENSSRQ